MTYQRLVVATALSLLPLLGAATAWYWVAPEEFVNAPRTRRLILLGIVTPPPAPPMAARWALGLLPPLALTLPVLPIVVLGRGLGRLHREDYSFGVAMLGVIVCAAAVGLSVMWELDRVVPPPRPPGVPEAIGRAWSFALPLAAAAGLGGVRGPVPASRAGAAKSVGVPRVRVRPPRQPAALPGVRPPLRADRSAGAGLIVGTFDDPRCGIE